MEITTSHKDGRVPVTVFHIQGEIAAESFEALQQQAKEAFTGGMRYLLLDLADVTYMSSAGLRAIHQIFTMLRADSPQGSDGSMRKGIAAGTYKSSHLKLLKPSKHVLQVLEQSGYDMFLDIYTDLQKAVNSF